MAEKKIGHGTTLKVDDDSDETFTDVSQIINISPPQPSREDVEATTLDDDVEQFLPSDPPNMGELSFTQAWTPGDTNHEIMDTLFGARTICPWQIVYSSLTTSKTDEFSGWVKSLGPEQITSKGLITRAVTIRLTSEIDRS